MWLELDNVVLTAAQAACVALPAAGLPAPLHWLRGRGWALIAPVSIAAVIVAINLLPSSADVLTWVALLLVPPGCAIGAGWAMHGARAVPGAILAAAALAITWAWPDGKPGQAAAIVLIAGSCVAIGRLLAGAAPLTLLKLGIVAMAVIDAILVFGNELQAPNAVLVAASPGAGLPQLQSASFGFAGLGYGDFFAAGLVGGILAAEGRGQLLAAAAMLAVSFLWDQLFLIYDVLPATVPPAIVLVAAWGLSHRRPARA